jgi:two-component system, response regulator
MSDDRMLCLATPLPGAGCLPPGPVTMQREEHTSVDMLLVEETPDDVKILLHILERTELINHVFITHDRKEALDFIFGTGTHAGRGTKRDLKAILLDHKLPRFDGIEILRRIKGDRKTQKIPIIALTPSSQESTITEIYNLGVNSCIVKPVDLDQFAWLMQNLCRYWCLYNQVPADGNSSDLMPHRGMKERTP